MDLKLLIVQLNASKVYAEWKKEHTDSYLANVFAVMNTDPVVWQVSFYNPDHTMTSFTINGHRIEVSPADQIFQETKHVVPALVLDSVGDTDDAMRAAAEVQKEHYAAHLPLKAMLTLQQTTIPIYTITYVTQSLKAIIVKMDATTGEIISHDLSAIVDFHKNK